MSAPRLYQPIPLQPQTVIELDSQASHHLARVLRAAILDPVIIFNGDGGEYPGHILHIDKKKVTVKLSEICRREVESPLKLTLAQGIARGEKMDYIIQKAVELGVSQIVPLLTERSSIRLDEERREKRFQHWQRIIISACEQSGRNTLPELLSPLTLANWLPTIAIKTRFVLSPHETHKLSSLASSPISQAVLLIGPEGGLSAKEVAQAKNEHFIPLNLGPRVLRTETATVAALTVLQSHFGDMV